MKWKYPLSDIDYGKEEEQAVLKVLRSKWLSSGPVTEKFEEEFSKYMGGGYSIAVSSGTAALHLALSCLNLKPEDEVILPSMTFIATANAVLYVGAKPIFADIVSIENPTISPESIERKITEKTRAIIVMHYGGRPCDMSSISTTAKNLGLYIIEDTAHALGSIWEIPEMGCGSIGNIGCFSFFANKNLPTGEGGMVFTKNKDFADRIKWLRSHGMKKLSWDKHQGRASSYDIEELGYNYRTTEIQSALGLIQLKKLNINNFKRKIISNLYDQYLEKVFCVTSNSQSSHHLYPILVEANKRDFIIEELKKFRIQMSVHYPPVHLFSLYQKRFGYRKGMLPKTEEFGKREISLPLHPLMKEKDVIYIANKVRKILKKI